MPRWPLAALSAVTAAVLAAGAVGVVSMKDDDAPAHPPTTSAPAPSSAPAPTSAPPPTPASAVAAEVPGLQAFVEGERGLSYKSPVKVTLLADGPFEERVRESDEEDEAEIRDAEAVLVAMGLLDRGVDLVATVRSFAAGAVLGFYDTETHELVVRGEEPSPFVRIVLVHELTHALEDQHFDLDREELGDEAYLGFSALVEGSALRIEDRYRASLSSADRRAASREERARSGSIPAGVPDLVRVIFGFPYAYGPDLVAAVVRAGGGPRLDQAFADPPASSEQVLDPPRYLRGDAPREVPVPRSDGDAFDDGEIGELFLSLMLRSELDDDAAADAARGWGGDRYVAWREGGRTCVRMTFVMDTPRDTAQLAEALADWAGERDGAASADGTTLRTCG